MLDSDEHIMHIPWLVLDLEFSGMAKGETIADERITEICAIKYDRGTPTDSISTLVNIGDRPIQPLVSRITGIWPSHLRHKPRFDQIASRVFSFFDDEPLVIAHNARKDLTVLRHEFSRLGIELSTEFMCSYKMAGVVFSYDKQKGLIKNFKLGTLAKHCEIPMNKAHRAQADTEACAKLTAYMLGCLVKMECNRPGATKHDINIGTLRRYGYIDSI